ncbi:hypothetical protein ALO82_200092 [Pseudomonas syringae pv. broussonetiae]|uniref:hypothetical protein n=1 Tax=Pseudomonas savastanoi TaxID=29438 RepID=UPI0006E4F5A9|nr:hypothetical protein [Pseudomonas savastanoi]KPW62251.1 hypothetical protein ALO82_200092 [Pseudomonas syringae pv. broussonetiae]KWT06631.1 hypothetical protein AL047_21110 [Pseudomonas syringae pv. broussonetiae]
MTNTNITTINAQNLAEEFNEISTILKTEFNTVLSTNISWMRMHPVLPAFMIDPMNWENTFPSSIRPVEYEDGIPQHLSVYNGRNYNEENSLLRASENFWALVEYVERKLSRDSELKKIGRNYYSRLLKTETTLGDEEYLRYELYDKAVIFKISKTQFNKVEKAVAREILKIVKTI